MLLFVISCAFFIYFALVIFNRLLASILGNFKYSDRKIRHLWVWFNGCANCVFEICANVMVFLIVL